MWVKRLLLLLNSTYLLGIMIVSISLGTITISNSAVRRPGNHSFFSFLIMEARMEMTSTVYVTGKLTVR